MISSDRYTCETTRCLACVEASLQANCKCPPPIFRAFWGELSDSSSTPLRSLEHEIRRKPRRRRSIQNVPEGDCFWMANAQCYVGQGFQASKRCSGLTILQPACICDPFQQIGDTTVAKIDRSVMRTLHHHWPNYLEPSFDFDFASTR